MCIMNIISNMKYILITGESSMNYYVAYQTKKIMMIKDDREMNFLALKFAEKINK